MKYETDSFPISTLFYLCAGIYALIATIAGITYYLAGVNVSGGIAAIISVLYLIMLVASLIFVRHSYFWHLKSTALLWAVIHTISFMSFLCVYQNQGPLPAEVYLLPLGVLSSYYLTNCKKLAVLATINIILFIFASIIITLGLSNLMFLVNMLSAFNIYFILNLIIIGYILRKQN